MGSLPLFIIEVVICVCLSTIVTVILTRPLRRLLVDACGSPERAHFWVVYSDAMIFLAPLVATIVFGKSSDLSGATLSFYKAALGSALFGIFVALTAVGLQVARLVPRRADERA